MRDEPDVFEKTMTGASAPRRLAGGEAMNTDDLRLLAEAKSRLMRPSLAIRLASVVGTRIDNLFRYLPGGAHEKITEIAQTALEKCLDVALKTLPAEARAGVLDGGLADVSPASAPGSRGRLSRSLATIAGGITRRTPQRSKLLHKLAVMGTGAAGGAFGLLALPAELPVTTTLMFRSICSIAQSKGEPLNDPAVQMQCLLVLALGGPAKSDDDAQWGYFMVRGALAQAVSRASSELAAKGLGAHTSSALLQLVRQIASRLSVQISEQVAAKSIPALGAVFGAAINAAFIDHFQHIAEAHFTVRSLERRYGEAHVRAQWEALPA